MRGRKPKPAGMSARRPERDESILASKLPAPPKYLDVEARREWRRLGAQLLRARVFSDVDAPALALYCMAHSRLVEAQNQLEHFGSVIDAPSGYLMPSPWLAIANKAHEQMNRLLVEFGMTPSSRARVTASWAPPAETPAKPKHAEHDPGVDPRSRLTRVI